MKFEALPSLLAPEGLPYQSGVERLDDGALHVAVLTRMPEVTPAMIAWWFGTYMQTPEHYRRWHPRDHVWMAWADKQAGTHIGAKHQVHEYIGGRLHKLSIAFVEPAEFGFEAVHEVPGALAICAYPGELERPIDLGRMVHLALPRPWGCELHSRFWLGYVRSRSGAQWLERLANRPFARRRAARTSFGRALQAHCHEEMTTLAGFLPGLHAAEACA